MIPRVFRRRAAVEWEPLTERRTRRRRQDLHQFLRDVAIIVLVIAMTVVVVVTERSLSKKVSAATRTEDLRAQCLRNSAARAADVNLNWVYYQSEAELASARPSPEVLAAIAQLPVADQVLLRLLSSGSNASRVALEVRATYDFNAAFVKAQSVDVGQIGLIGRRTPLGSERPVRRWVRRAGYSCVKAFR